jgi:hypothetical protein
MLLIMMRLAYLLMRNKLFDRVIHFVWHIFQYLSKLKTAISVH